MFLVKSNQKGEGFMEMLKIERELRDNSYPGRGIIIGRSADGTKAAAAYFICLLYTSRCV